MKKLFGMLIMVFSITMLSCTGADCTNGIQDGDETDIDCGGTCPPCPIPAPIMTPLETSLLGKWQLYSSNNNGIIEYHSGNSCQVEFTSDPAGTEGYYRSYGSVGLYQCSYPSEWNWNISSSDLLQNYWQIDVTVDSLHLTSVDGTEILTYYH